MDIDDRVKQEFRAAFQYVYKRKRVPILKMANSIGVSARYLQKILSDKEKGGAGPELSRRIASYLGYDYLDFIEVGKAILDEGKYPPIVSNNRSRSTLIATGDHSTNTPIHSHDNTESPVSVKVTHNNGPAPPQSGKRTIELSEKEERIIKALRKIGKDDYTDGLMEKVESVAKALSW